MTNREQALRDFIQANWPAALAPAVALMLLNKEN